MASLKEQVVYLTSELATAKSDLETRSSERSQLVGALDLLRGSSSALSSLNIAQCEQLEAQLRNSLEAVEARKVRETLFSAFKCIFILLVCIAGGIDTARVGSSKGTKTVCYLSRKG
jgi:hypothetical protein